MKREHRSRLLFVVVLPFAVSAICGSYTGAETIYLSSLTLPYTGGLPQLQGDIVAVQDGAAAVYSRDDGESLRLMFYRFGPAGDIVFQKQYNSEAFNFYEPSICWDGENFGVAFSTFTQSRFMILSPAGDVVLAPVEYDRAPPEWRTAAFRIIWTGDAYAVFAVWAEPITPGAQVHYTHLNYRLLDKQGQVLKSKDLGSITPISYPGFEGAEKKYYDAVWTGASFFIVHQSEIPGFPPVFTSAYKIIDLDGNVIKAETPIFADITAQGADVAWNGRVVGVTGLHEVPFYMPNPGNYLYARFFDPAGNPVGPDIEYTDPTLRTGAGPTIFTHGYEFRAAYSMPESLYSLDYTVWMADFDLLGGKTRNSYPVTDPLNVFSADMNLAYDLQLSSNGNLIFGKGLVGVISQSPMIFLIQESAPDHDDVFNLSRYWFDPLESADLLDLIRRTR